MELKKHPKVNLERFRGIFLQVGFLVTVGLIFLAFEWSTSNVSVDDLGKMNNSDIEEEIIPVTRQEDIPPPVKQEKPQVINTLEIMDDEADIDDEAEIEDTEADDDTEIKVDDIEEDDEEEEPEVFFIVENMPIFPGGEIGLRKYIATHVRYPTVARENGIQGKVFVRFIVNYKGKVGKVSIARGVDPLLDKEAIRVIKTLPQWKAGEQRGKKVSVWFTVPINFQLQ